jgi:DDE_Tnp_1-associated
VAPNRFEVALKSFERFLALLATIHDPRRAEGKLYQPTYVLLFSILAIVSGANSYRGICTFIKVHRRKLNKAFKIGWKTPPAHTAIRYILQGLTGRMLKRPFANMQPTELRCSFRYGSIRVWRQGAKGSFDSCNDAKAKQVLSARCRHGAGAGGYRNSTWLAILSRAMRCIVKKTFEAAAAASAYVIIQLKDNQPTLCQKVEAAYNTALPLSGVRTVDEKKRNRHKTRIICRVWSGARRRRDGMGAYESEYREYGYRQPAAPSGNFTLSTGSPEAVAHPPAPTERSVFLALRSSEVGSASRKE